MTVASTTVQTRLGQLSYPEYLDYRDRLRSFLGLIAYTVMPMAVSEGGRSVPQMTLGAVVTGNFFRVLGIDPPIGRSFTNEKDRVPVRDAVAVLSHGFWALRFARHPGVVGRVIRLNGFAFTIIGVAPESFTGLDLGVQPGVFVPTAMWARVARAVRDPRSDRMARPLTVKGRLAEGHSTPSRGRRSRLGSINPGSPTRLGCPTDLPAYLLLPFAVMFVSLIAAWAPARRAAAVEPTVALRSE